MTHSPDSDPALISARAASARLTIASEQWVRDIARDLSGWPVTRSTLETLLKAAFLAGATHQVIDDINHAPPPAPVRV